MSEITKNLIINYDFFDWQNSTHVNGWNVELYNGASYQMGWAAGSFAIQIHTPVGAYYDMVYNYVYLESGIYSFSFGGNSTMNNDPIRVLIKSVIDDMSYRLDTNEWVNGDYYNTVYLNVGYSTYNYTINVDKVRQIAIHFIKSAATNDVYNIYGFVRLDAPYIKIHHNNFLFYLDEVFFNKDNGLYFLTDPTYKILKNMNYPVYINIYDFNFIEGYDDGWIINYDKLESLNKVPVPIFLNISLPLSDVQSWGVPRETDFDGTDGYPHASAMADLIDIILNKVNRSDINILLFEHVSHDIETTKYNDFINYINTIVSNVRSNHKSVPIGIVDISDADFFMALLDNANDDLKSNYIDIEYKREFVFTNFTDVLKDKNGYPYHVLYRKSKFDESNFNVVYTIINGRNINGTMCSKHAARFFDYFSNLRYPILYMIDLYDTSEHEEFLSNANYVGNDYWLFYLWRNYVEDGIVVKYTHGDGFLDFQYLKNGINRLFLNKMSMTYNVEMDGFILYYDGPFMMQTNSVSTVGSNAYGLKLSLPSALKYSEKDSLIYGVPILSIKNNYLPNSNNIKINNRFRKYKEKIFAFTNTFDVSGKVFYDYYATDQYETSMFSTRYYFLKAVSQFPTASTEDIKVITLEGKEESTIIKFNEENHVVVYHNNFEEPLLLSYPAITDSGIITDHTELLSSESAVKVSLVGDEIITYESGIHYLMLREKYPVVYLDNDLDEDQRWIPYLEPYKFVYNDTIYDSSTYHTQSMKRVSVGGKRVKDSIYKVPHRNIINNGKYKVESEYGRVLSVDYMNGYIMLDGDYGEVVKFSYNTYENIYLYGTELNYTIPYFVSSEMLNSGMIVGLYISPNGIYYKKGDIYYNAVELFESDFSYKTGSLSPSFLSIALIASYIPWDADMDIEDIRQKGGGIETDEFFKYYAEHVLNLDTEKIAILDVIREYFPDVDNYVDISTYDQFYDIMNNTIVVNITKDDSQNIRNLLRPIKVYNNDFYTKIGIKEDIKGLFFGNINSVYDQLTDEYIKDLHDNENIRFIGIDVHMGDVDNDLINKLNTLVDLFRYHDVYMLLKGADSGIVSESTLVHGWDMISYHFKDEPFLIYDICGFPMNDNWNEIAINVINTIRSNSKENLILVPGLYGYDLHAVSGIQFHNVAFSLHIENLADYSSLLNSYIGYYPFVVSYVNMNNPIGLLDTLSDNGIGWLVLKGIADDYVYSIIKKDPITEYLVEYFKDVALKTKAYGIPLVLRYHNLEEVIP